ncbi:MAG: hypothetical protein WC810_14350 [Janthinobacterium sp.]|jgi:hypothetical protein
MIKQILGETHDMLRILPLEQVQLFAKIRENEKEWITWNKYVYDQKQIKLNRIYCLKRPKSNDELIRNAVDHEYYVARISSLALLLELMENASSELERRARKEK